MSKITGYRQLTDTQVMLMNQVKEKANEVQQLLEQVETMGTEDFWHIDGRSGGTVDRRWLSIGVTDLQKGFMSINRAIAQPESF